MLPPGRGTYPGVFAAAAPVNYNTGQLAWIWAKIWPSPLRLLPLSTEATSDTLQHAASSKPCHFGRHRGSKKHSSTLLEFVCCPQELGDLVDKTTVVSSEAKCFERTSLPPAQQLSNFPEPWETDVQWFLGFQAHKQVVNAQLSCLILQDNAV